MEIKRLRFQYGQEVVLGGHTLKKYGAQITVERQAEYLTLICEQAEVVEPAHPIGSTARGIKDDPVLADSKRHLQITLLPGMRICWRSANLKE